jgi:hypothetical protein
MSDYLVFDTAEQAQSMLDFINAYPVFPIVGVNAATGQPATDAQQTTQWAAGILQRVDGKWCFPAIPPARWRGLGITPAFIDQCIRVFGPTIEAESPDWWQAPEEG